MERMSDIQDNSQGKDSKDGGVVEGRPTIHTIFSLVVALDFILEPPEKARGFRTSLVPQTIDVRLLKGIPEVVLNAFQGLWRLGGPGWPVFPSSLSSVSCPL